jgi:hypothetical protein
MSQPSDRSQADADRSTFRQGVLIGVLLGITTLCLGSAYAMGAFDRPEPPRDAYPCGGQLVDIEADPANCGACGIVCAAETPICDWGSCNCVEGLYLCDATCIDLARDPQNCGSCGLACPAGVACVGSSCACEEGLAACEMESDDEGHRTIACVDTYTDASHCGSCFSTCPASGAGCHDGACDCGELTWCRREDDYPACVDTRTDYQHCGACNHACEGECIGGVCR